MSKKKISREDAVLFAKLLKEAGLDKKADSIPKQQKGELKRKNV